MSIKKVSKVQPDLFEYTNENLEKANNEIKKFINKKIYLLHFKNFTSSKIFYLESYNLDLNIYINECKSVIGVKDLKGVKWSCKKLIL